MHTGNSLFGNIYRAPGAGFTPILRAGHALHLLGGLAEAGMDLDRADEQGEAAAEQGEAAAEQAEQVSAGGQPGCCLCRDLLQEQVCLRFMAVS